MCHTNAIVRRKSVPRPHRPLPSQLLHFPAAIRAGTSGPVNQWWRTTLRKRMPG